MTGSASAQTGGSAVQGGLIPVEVLVDAQGKVMAAFRAERPIPLPVRPDAADWAKSSQGRTRFEVRTGDQTRGVFELPLRGQLLVGGDSADRAKVFTVDEQRSAYRVDIEGAEKITLLFRPAQPPRVALLDGYGRFNKGVGSRNEGGVSGTLRFEKGRGLGRLVLDLDWQGKRLFGLLGAKSRTIRIPVRQLTKAEWVRRADRDDRGATVGTRSYLALAWHVPANDRDRRQGKNYSTATLDLVAEVSRDGQSMVTLVDALLRQREHALEQVCCYAGSSLSAFLRYARTGLDTGGRCAQIRRCTDEEKAWFAR